MKRSKMLDLIHKKLDGLPINHGDWENQILTAVEECGMIPPIEDGRTVYDLDLGIPEWEPEDEN